MCHVYLKVANIKGDQIWKIILMGASEFLSYHGSAYIHTVYMYKKPFQIIFSTNILVIHGQYSLLKPLMSKRLDFQPCF